MIFTFMPVWLEYLIAGLMAFITLACAGVVLARAGRSPFWALVLVLPYAQVIAVWIFAFCRWPRVKDDKV